MASPLHDICQMCKKNTVKYQCSDCTLAMCELCIESCSYLKGTCRHMTLKMAEGNKSVGIGNEQKTVDILFCKTCNSQLSSEDSDKHKKHAIVDLETKANEIRKELLEQITNLKKENKRIQKSCKENSLQKLTNLKKIGEAVDQEFSRIIKVLQESLQFVKRKRESQYDSYLKQLKTKQSEVNQNIENIKTLSSKVKSCMPIDLVTDHEKYEEQVDQCHIDVHFPTFDDTGQDVVTSLFVQALQSEEEKATQRRLQEEHDRFEVEKKYFENALESIMALLKSLYDYRTDTLVEIQPCILPCVPEELEPSRKKTMRKKKTNVNDDLKRFTNIVVELIEFEKKSEQERDEKSQGTKNESKSTSTLIEFERNSEQESDEISQGTKNEIQSSSTNDMEMIESETENKIKELENTVAKLERTNGRRKAAIETIIEWTNICHNNVKKTVSDQVPLALPSDFSPTGVALKTLNGIKGKLEDILQHCNGPCNKLIVDTDELNAVIREKEKNITEMEAKLEQNLEIMKRNVKSQKKKGNEFECVCLWIDSISQNFSDNVQKKDLRIPEEIEKSKQLDEILCQLQWIEQMYFDKKRQKKNWNEFECVCSWIDCIRKNIAENMQKNELRIPEEIEETKQLDEALCQLQWIEQVYFDNTEKFQLKKPKRSGLKISKNADDKQNIDLINNYKDAIVDLEKKLSRSATELAFTKNEKEKALREKEKTLTRLSEIAGSRLREQNPMIADLSDEYRPTKLGEKFSELYDNEWTDAFSFEIKKMKHDDKLAIQRLLEILQGIFDTCKLMVREQLKTFFCHDEKEPEECKKARANPMVSIEMRKKVKDFQKQMVPDMLEVVEQVITSAATYTEKFKEEAAHCCGYIRSCIRLCWIMNVHDPPMVLVFDLNKGKPFDTKLFKHYTKSGGIADYLVWPAILLHEDGPLLNKGVAQPL